MLYGFTPTLPADPMSVEAFSAVLEMKLVTLFVVVLPATEERNAVDAATAC